MSEPIHSECENARLALLAAAEGPNWTLRPEVEEAARHAASCEACSGLVDSEVPVSLAALPVEIEAPSDLWQAVRDSTGQPANSAAPDAVADPSGRGAVFDRRLRLAIGRPTARVAMAAAATVILGILIRSVLLPGDVTYPTTWRVTALDAETGRANSEPEVWRPDEPRSVDPRTRLLVEIEGLGDVRLEPGARATLRAASASAQRLDLHSGRLAARIDAPPRLFVVHTPSASAIDLGCAYDLEVDSLGSGHLTVTSGWVALAWRGAETVVPAGASAGFDASRGPNPPVFRTSPPGYAGDLNDVLTDTTDRDAFDRLLQASGPAETITLWHLLPRLDADRRGQIHDALNAMGLAHAAVTRQDLASGKPRAFELTGLRLQEVWTSVSAGLDESPLPKKSPKRRSSGITKPTRSP